MTGDIAQMYPYMIFTTLDHLEYPIVTWLQNIDGTVLDSFSEIVSNITFMLIVFGIIVFTLYLRKHHLWRPLLGALIIAITIDFIVNEGFFKTLLVEFWVFRPRPYTIHPDLLQIGQGFHDSSFPSSHMAFTTLLVMIITYFEKWFLKYGILIILLMWLSRVHNGMHYPTDVLMGTLMGVLYWFTGLYIMQKFGLEKKHWWKKILEN